MWMLLESHPTQAAAFICHRVLLAWGLLWAVLLCQGLGMVWGLWPPPRQDGDRVPHQWCWDSPGLSPGCLGRANMLKWFHNVCTKKKKQQPLSWLWAGSALGRGWNPAIGEGSCCFLSCRRMISAGGCLPGLLEQQTWEQWQMLPAVTPARWSHDPHAAVLRVLSCCNPVFRTGGVFL